MINRDDIRIYNRGTFVAPRRFETLRLLIEQISLAVPILKVLSIHRRFHENRTGEYPDDLSAGSGKFLNDRSRLIARINHKCRISRILGRGLFNQSYLVRRKSETSCCSSMVRRARLVSRRTVQRLYKIGQRCATTHIHTYTHTTNTHACTDFREYTIVRSDLDWRA